MKVRTRVICSSEGRSLRKQRISRGSARARGRSAEHLHEGPDAGEQLAGGRPDLEGALEGNRRHPALLEVVALDLLVDAAEGAADVAVEEDPAGAEHLHVLL